MLKELSEDINSIKKILQKQRNQLKYRIIYRETTVEWLKQRIKSNDLEHKEAKNNQ